MTELTQRLAYRGAKHRADLPALDVRDMAMTYSRAVRVTPGADRTVNALEAISFQAAKGDQIAIIGPNGAGKSTLLKVMAGLLKPDSGRVEMFGSEPDKHICIAYVSQRSEIDFSFPVTAADVVMMGRTKQIGLFRRPGKRDHEIVRASLDRVGAVDLAGMQIGELSGGQQQRIFIARALALETDLLLLDEPLSGLDIPSREALLGVLDSLRPDGVTVMAATHDLSLAAERFDKVMLLNRRIVAFGQAAETLSQENLFTAYGGLVVKGRRGNGLAS